MAVVVDLVDHPNGTIVHLDVLPGALDTTSPSPAWSPPPHRAANIIARVALVPLGVWVIFTEINGFERKGFAQLLP